MSYSFLGRAYDLGVGVVLNRNTGVKWYRKAADQGHATAQNNLDVCYKNSRGGGSGSDRGERLCERKLVQCQ
jgi:TPR repeat protein